MLRPLACLLALLPMAQAGDAPPQAQGLDIPIWIELDKPQLVTAVIEDANGVRVRNLIAETHLPAGRNRLSWDGYDDGIRQKNGDILRKLAAPGTYRVRGLTHDGIKLIYELSAYSGGNPPWPTNDSTGGWLADHSAPLGAVFLPAKSGSPYGEGKAQVMLTAIVAEAGKPFVWTDLDGKTVQRRGDWGWWGAIALARDAGKDAVSDIYAYGVMAWPGSIEIKGFKTNGAGHQVVGFPTKNKGPGEPRHEGHSLAVCDGLLVTSLVTDDELAFIDVRAGKVINTLPMPKPRGLLFDAKGRLLVVSDGKVLRFEVQRPKAGADKDQPPIALGKPTVLIDKGLDNPRILAFDPTCSELFVSNWGKSHQIKVFTPDGKPLRTIGTANDGAQQGLYDELKMQAPQGMAIDDRGQLWVVEAAHLPKRISLWNAKTGAFTRAIYGPPPYGGGGNLDPNDKSRFFLSDYYGLMQFKIDWKTGVSKPYTILVNGSAGGQKLVDRFGPEYGSDPKGGPSRWGFVPDRPTVINGRTYLYPSWGNGGRWNSNNCIWMIGDDHVARPVARIGGTGFSWPPQLNEAFFANVPKGAHVNRMIAAWSDRNGNGKVDSDEWSTRQMEGSFVTGEGESRPIAGFGNEGVYPDLSATTNWSMRIPAPTFDAKGIPSWDLSKVEPLLPFSERYRSEDYNPWWGSGTTPVADGWVLSGGGWRDGKLMWTYPSLPERIVASRGGDMVYPTRALGPPMLAPQGEAGWWYAQNGEKGNIYLMSSDGLFLQTLGGDMRNTPLLRFPTAERGMVIDEPGKHISFEDEHFNPTIHTTKDGEIYLVAGKEHSSIFRVEGFASMKRRTFPEVKLEATQLAKLPAEYLISVGKQGTARMGVEVGTEDAVIDGKLDEYAQWVPIGDQGGNQASVRFGAKLLSAAWKTTEAKPLANNGGDFRFLFKGGGSVDLFLRTQMGDRHWDPAPRAGDLRLLATMVKGKVAATLYRPVVPGTKESSRVLFDSPVGKVLIDSVTDVSAQVKLVVVGGNVELGIPLEVLGLTPPKVHSEWRGDLGLLRGDGTQTIQRLYWNNTDTMIVSDIPSEARFQPANWGIWTMQRALPSKPIPAVKPAKVEPGLAYRYFEGDPGRLPDFAKAKPAATGTTPVVQLKGVVKRAEKHAVEFSGFIDIPREGAWTFVLNSDDGSRLWLGDDLLVDNDGDYNPQDHTGSTRLAKGLHPIRIGYRQGDGGAKLEVRWIGPEVTDSPIPASALFHTP
jgi:hypothetical protein